MDTNTNISELVEEHVENSLLDRVTSLEKRVIDQDNEILSLKTSLADLLKKLEITQKQSIQTSSAPIQSKKLPTTHKTNGHTKPAAPTASSNALRPSQEKPTSSLLKNRSVSNNSLLLNESRSTQSAKTTVADKPAHSSKRQTSAMVTSESHQQLSKDKDTTITYNIDNSTVKLYLRGRPITVQLPTVYSDPLNELKFDINKKLDASKFKLELNWVYGYRGKDCRSNLYQLDTGEIIYFIAATVILLNIEERVQRHYREHTDDIKCLAIHPDRITIATGQVTGHDKHEGKAHIRIWNSINLNTIKIIGLSSTVNNESSVFNNSVCCLSFSKVDGGQQLCVIDDGNEKYLSVWNWQNGTKICSTKCYNDLIFAVEYHPTEKNIIVSCGKQHIFFWQVNVNLDSPSTNLNLNKKLGTFDKLEKPKYILCITYLLNGDVISGDSEGNLLIWNFKDGKITKSIKEAHDGGVFSIYVLKNQNNEKNVSLISGGGKDGKLVEWTNSFTKSGRVLQIPETSGFVRFVTCVNNSNGGDNTYLVGTTKNCIYKANFDDESLICIINGHFEELWGLDTHPNDLYFLTCGNDKQLVYWDLLTHSPIWSLQIDQENNDTSSTPHCINIHPKLNNICAIGFAKPKWSIYDLTERKCVFTQVEGTEQIECVQYSPSGQYLACGSRDNSIYIYNCNEDGTKYIRMGRCHGHSAFITHIDWSIDNNYLMSNSGDYEILYWQASTCKQLTNVQQIRDLDFATNTCTLSSNTIGIWNSVDVNHTLNIGTYDGTDINACCASNSKECLVSVDDFGKVNLFKYPCCASKAEKRVYKGHSSHITNVKFIYDDSRVLTIGGNDMAIFEWSLVSNE